MVRANCLLKLGVLLCVFQGYIQDDDAIRHQKCNKSPNFLIIVADDLGWSDTSPFGGEIKTPNIQKLANYGTRFIDFHTASACSPTRAMLMSGTDHHIAGLGQLAEIIGLFPQIYAGKPGYEGYLNKRVVALPEILRDAGYFTTMSGKWHLGRAVGQYPADRGFDDSFATLGGGMNHYFADQFFPPLRTVYVRNSELVNRTTLEGFYSSDYLADQLIESLKRNCNGDKKPFFAYLPFAAPHWPLQAPADLIAKYKGKYDKGPDVLRQTRLKRQRALGLLSPDVDPSPVYTDAPEWNILPSLDRNFYTKAMEIYAAMVERMDDAIGHVIDYLKESDQFENTFILFMSDNGAEGMDMGNVSMASAALVPLNVNNSYENIGNKDSFVVYGPRWAQASTAPSRRSKGHIVEGGIRSPAIVHYPKFRKPLKISHEFTTVMDILPTVLELANIPHPGTTYQNHTIVKPKGKSWIAHLLSSNEHVHHVQDELDFTAWELFGERAIRRGNYKAILMPNKTNTADWELYDLNQDKGELNNLADQQVNVLNELIQAWNMYQAEMGVIIPEDAWSVRYPARILVLFGLQNATS